MPSARLAFFVGFFFFGGGGGVSVAVLVCVLAVPPVGVYVIATVTFSRLSALITFAAEQDGVSVNVLAPPGTDRDRLATVIVLVVVFLCLPFPVVVLTFAVAFRATRPGPGNVRLSDSLPALTRAARTTNWLLAVCAGGGVLFGVVLGGGVLLGVVLGGGVLLAGAVTVICSVTGAATFPFTSVTVNVAL